MVCTAAAVGGVADGEASEGDVRRALAGLSCLGREGRRRAERFLLEEEDEEDDLVKNGSFLPPDRFPMASRARGGGAAPGTRHGDGWVGGFCRCGPRPQVRTDVAEWAGPGPRRANPRHEATARGAKALRC